MKLLGTDPTTPDDARKAVRYAGIGGLVAAGLTVALIAYVSTAPSSPLGGQFSPWALIDVAIMAVLSVGTLRANRFAAGGLLGYYLLNQVVMRVSSGEVGSIMLAVVFVLLFVQGLRGAITLHRLERDGPLADRIDAIAAPGADPTG